MPPRPVTGRRGGDAAVVTAGAGGSGAVRRVVVGAASPVRCAGADAVTGEAGLAEAGAPRWTVAEWVKAMVYEGGPGRRRDAAGGGAAGEQRPGGR